MVVVLMLGVSCPQLLLAAGTLVKGSWYQVTDFQQNQTPAFLSDPTRADQYTPVEHVSLTGGHFVFVGKLNVPNDPPMQVIDFKNSSVIEGFLHRVYDKQNHLVATALGGIKYSAPNPFFLRHGREFQLEPGEYTVITEVVAPFFLARPSLFVMDISHYRQSIKKTNVLTLLCAGILSGLGIYYLILAVARRRRTEILYAFFIISNLLFSSCALLILSDVFDIHNYYLVSVPILFSNAAYILFVMSLLEVTTQDGWLYRSAQCCLVVLVGFIAVAWLKPNYSLEMARYGVHVFLVYGLVAAIVKSMQGNPSAKRYIFAIGIFFISGLSAISLTSIDGAYAAVVEHLGTVSVTVEVICLAVVLA